MAETRLEHIHPDGLHGELGTWTHAVAVDPRQVSRLVFISGQTSVDLSGTVVGPDDLEAQFHQVYRNLRRVAEACGGGLDQIVSLRTFLTRREDIDRFRALRDRVHQELFPRGTYPAHTLLLVSGLALPTLLIEVEAIVAV